MKVLKFLVYNSRLAKKLADVRSDVQYYFSMIEYLKHDSPAAFSQKKEYNIVE